jgi:hypothetical protein
MRALVSTAAITGFRSIQHSRLDLGPLCALVGEPETASRTSCVGCAACWTRASTRCPRIRRGAAPRKMELEAVLRSGGRVRVAGRPPSTRRSHDTSPPPVLYLPTTQRDRELLEPGSADDHPAALLLRRAAAYGDTEPATIRAFDRCLSEGVRGIVVLMDEPELYLRPQGQRLLYRLLRRFVEAGNQVIYSTHAPTFLNAAGLDEVRLVERLPDAGTRAAGAAPVTPDQDFRVLSEFDAERSELLLARSALLVEGLTEKLAFPFVFASLDLDADREGVTIVECGGKANLPLFARVCHAAGVPCVAVHDRDAPIGRRPRRSERVLNELVRRIAGADRTIVIEPDFEGLAHLPGGERKPEQAWRRFAALDGQQIPEPLARAARLAVELARSGAPR